jgi:hypothetical protein
MPQDGKMPIKSIRDWLKEHEQKNHSVFLLEWLSIFAIALAFWTFLFHKLEISPWSTAAAATTAVLYACGFIYLRVYQATRCRKCNSPLPLMRQEVGRRRTHDEERCLEIERGGEDYEAHFIDIYYRIYHVEIVKFRCRSCHKVWEETERSPASNFKFVRTICVKD